MGLDFYKVKQLVLSTCDKNELITHLLVLPCDPNLDNPKWMLCFLELIEFDNLPNHVKLSYIYFAIDKNITSPFLVALFKKTKVIEFDEHHSSFYQSDTNHTCVNSFIMSIIEDKKLHFLDVLFKLSSDINHLKKYMVMALEHGVVLKESSLIDAWPNILEFFCKKITTEKTISLLTIIFCARKHIKNVAIFEKMTNEFFALKLNQYLSNDYKEKLSLSRLDEYLLSYAGLSSSSSSSCVNLMDLNVNTMQIPRELLTAIWNSIEKTVDVDCQSNSNVGFFAFNKSPKFWSLMPHLKSQIKLSKAIEQMSTMNVKATVFVGKDVANKHFHRLFYTIRQVILDLIATDKSLLNDTLESNYQFKA